MPTAEGPDIPNIHSTQTHVHMRARTRRRELGLPSMFRTWCFFNKRAADKATGPPVHAAPSDDLVVKVRYESNGSNGLKMLLLCVHVCIVVVPMTLLFLASFRMVLPLN